MKNRYIPYGYTIRNGKLVIEKDEAEIIRQIYEQYVAGASLKEIADQLTKRQVPYSEKTADWGKARVARIIGNTKYLGTDEYDKIIDDSLFEDARLTKSDRQTGFVPTGLDAEIAVIKPHVFCSACGYRMTRKGDKRLKIKAEWTCTNPECQSKVKINDEDLMEKVIAIIHRVKENEKLLDMPPISIKPTARQEELERMLAAELEKTAPDEDVVMNFIAEIANDQYVNTNAEAVNRTADIKNRIRRIEIREGFQKELFEAIVQDITLGTVGVEIITRNNIKIGEENGSQGHPEEDGNGHTTEE